MGWQARNRLNDLRAAPVEGRAQAPGKVITQVDYVALAGAALTSMAVGAQTPYRVGQQMLSVPLPDFVPIVAMGVAALEEKFGPDREKWPPLEVDRVMLCELVAEVQQRELEIRKRWIARKKAEQAQAPPPAPGDALPEAPGEDRPPVGLNGDAPP